MPNGTDDETYSIRFEWLCLVVRVMYGASVHKGIPWPAVSAYLPMLSRPVQYLTCGSKEGDKRKSADVDVCHVAKSRTFGPEPEASHRRLQSS